MNKNIVLWLPQVTIDYTFMLPDHIERICGHFRKNRFFPEHHGALQNISDFGLKQDHNLRLDNVASLTDLGRALEYVRTQFPGTEIAQIGGTRQSQLYGDSTWPRGTETRQFRFHVTSESTQPRLRSS